MINLDSTYWNDRYLQNNFTWDIGYASTPLKTYFDQIKDKTISILIPGAGNAYEASYLVEHGFTNVHVLDFAEEPLLNFKQANPQFPSERIHQTDFFEHEQRYDLIIEQTFFCALNPSLRQKYAVHMHQLLKPKGKLVGLLFDDALNADKPPFGGNKEEYKHYFEPYFLFKTFEPAYNSIKPRSGRELFMILEKK